MADGGGLYLLCRTNGSKLWQMKYRYGGKERTLSLRPYPRVSLADARQGREDTKKQLAFRIQELFAKKESFTFSAETKNNFKAVIEFCANNIAKPQNAKPAGKAA